MTQIKIDKGVPIPAAQWGTGKRKYPFPCMEIGDSFFTDTKQETVVSSVTTYAIFNNKKFTTRSENGGTRVWRIA